MRHDHLVLTVDADTRDRIGAHLDDGESIDDWVRDAIDRKLAETEDEEFGGYEFVDDCSI